MHSALRSILAALTVSACQATAPAVPPEQPAPSSPADRAKAQFDALATDFLDGFYRFSPVHATSDGDHRFDGEWPDLSPKGRAWASAWVNDMLAEAACIDRATLDEDRRVDLDLVQARLESMRFSADIERPYERNPYAYAGLLGAGLDDLISRDFAPLGDRAKSLAARLEGVPALVDQAIANLQPAEAILAPHARVAVAQLKGVQALIRDELPAKTKTAPPAIQARINKATGPALAAVEKLAQVTEQQLLPKANGQWRLGAEAFAHKLGLTLQTDLTADEVHALARKTHAQVRVRMAEVARELYDPLFGAGALKKFLARVRMPADAIDREIVQQVLAELAVDHPAAADLRNACEANLNRLKQFVGQQKLVPLNEQEVLEVIWTPPHARGYAIAGLASPGPLEPQGEGLPSFYLVQPVPNDWPASQRESFLREYNSFMLEILSIHEAIPGHFVQLYHGKRDDSKLRRVLGNGPFVEGWAVYTERLMVEAGYHGAAPNPAALAKLPAGLKRIHQSDELRGRAIELHGLKFYLRTVTNAILDHEIHAGTMDETAALALMTRESFQEEGEAQGKWVRAQLGSTQLSTYFVGAAAWFRLRDLAEARAKKQGQTFNVEAFHRDALSHGSPPVHRLPALMGW